jgi:hypothetical protein
LFGVYCATPVFGLGDAVFGGRRVRVLRTVFPQMVQHG